MGEELGDVAQLVRLQAVHGGVLLVEHLLEVLLGCRVCVGGGRGRAGVGWCVVVMVVVGGVRV